MDPMFVVLLSSAPLAADILDGVQDPNLVLVASLVACLLQHHFVRFVLRVLLGTITTHDAVALESVQLVFFVTFLLVKKMTTSPASLYKCTWQFTLAYLLQVIAPRTTFWPLQSRQQQWRLVIFSVILLVTQLLTLAYWCSDVDLRPSDPAFVVIVSDGVATLTSIVVELLFLIWTAVNVEILKINGPDKLDLPVLILNTAVAGVNLYAVCACLNTNIFDGAFTEQFCCLKRAWILYSCYNRMTRCRSVLSQLEDVHCDATCTICLDDLKFHRSSKKMPCGHAFHPACLRKWLISHNGCPLCRRTYVGTSYTAAETLALIQRGPDDHLNRVTPRDELVSDNRPWQSQSREGSRARATSTGRLDANVTETSPVSSRRTSIARGEPSGWPSEASSSRRMHHQPTAPTATTTNPLPAHEPAQSAAQRSLFMETTTMLDNFFGSPVRATHFDFPSTTPGGAVVLSATRTDHNAPMGAATTTTTVVVRVLRKHDKQPRGRHVETQVSDADFQHSESSAVASPVIDVSAFDLLDRNRPTKRNRAEFVGAREEAEDGTEEGTVADEEQQTGQVP